MCLTQVLKIIVFATPGMGVSMEEVELFIIFSVYVIKEEDNRFCFRKGSSKK